MTAFLTSAAVPAADAVAALPYPGEEPAALDAVADRITDAILLLATLADHVDDVRSVLPQAWRGASARTGSAEIERIRRALADGSERLYRARSALFGCADELRVVRSAVERLRQDWRRAEGSVRALDAALVVAVEPMQQQVLTDQRRAGVIRRDLASTAGTAAVARADQATLVCRAVLTATISGEQVFAAGRGVITADLGTALGTAAMVSDDWFRAGVAAMADDESRWASLGSSAQAFALATAGALPATSGPAMSAAWWASRTWQERQAVLHADPGTVGATDGLPATARDQANRLALDARERLVQQALDAREPALAGVVPGSPGPTGPAPGDSGLALIAALAVLRHEQSTITRLRTQLGSVRGQPLFLLGADTTGRGRAVVSIGDPDTADQVATYVPGTSSDVSGYGGELDRVQAWTEGAAEFGGRSTAGVVWLGYESPPGLGAAAADSYADAGAPALAAFQQGLRASHQSEPSRNVVIGHSYGALVVAAASTGDNILAADGLLFLGPVGLEVDAVTDLQLAGVPPGETGDRVLSVIHRNDLIGVTTMVHGGAPYDSSFGAQVVVTDAVGGLGWRDVLGGGIAVAWDLIADGVDAHGEYQDPGSVEQRTTSAFIVGAVRGP